MGNRLKNLSNRERYNPRGIQSALVFLAAFYSALLIFCEAHIGKRVFLERYQGEKQKTMA